MPKQALVLPCLVLNMVMQALVLRESFSIMSVQALVLSRLISIMPKQPLVLRYLVLIIEKQMVARIQVALAPTINGGERGGEPYHSRLRLPCSVGRSPRDRSEGVATKVAKVAPKRESPATKVAEVAR